MNEVKKDGIFSKEARLSVCKFKLMYCVDANMQNNFFFFSVDPPKVIQHPNSQSVPTGGETTFTVETTGDDLTFQWQKNASDVYNDSNHSGTDTNTLRFQYAKKSDGGRYRCQVKNEVKQDGTLSKEAQLSVCTFFIIILCECKHAK